MGISVERGVGDRVLPSSLAGEGGQPPNRIAMSPLSYLF